MKERILEIIAEQFNMDVSELDEDMNFQDDLNADSIELVELVMTIEEEFETEVSPRTQVMASVILLLPLPFGPTIAVVVSSNSIFVLFAKDLNPCIVTDFKNIYSPIIISYINKLTKFSLNLNMKIS